MVTHFTIRLAMPTIEINSWVIRTDVKDVHINAKDKQQFDLKRV